jgi:hypothetical protein
MSSLEEQSAELRRLHRKYEEQARREKEAEAKCLAPLKLTQFEQKLFLQLVSLEQGGFEECVVAVEEEYVIEQVFGVLLSRPDARWYARLLGRLRTLKCRLNKKLKAAGSTLQVVRVKPGCLCVVDVARPVQVVCPPALDAEAVEKPNKSSGTARLKPQRRRKIVAQCVERIRHFLTAHPECPARSLQVYCEDRGYSRGTVKKARKVLGVKTRRYEFGRRGFWIVYLPPK